MKLLYTVYVPNSAIAIFTQFYGNKQAIKKIDTIPLYVFLSLGFADIVSYENNYPSVAGDNSFVVSGIEQDKCSNSG